MPTRKPDRLVGWPDDVEQWQTHGNAKVARDLAAEIFNRIEVETHLLLSLMSKGKLIREEGLERLAKMNRLANIGCRILQEQGAQIRPMQFEDLL